MRGNPLEKYSEQQDFIIVEDDAELVDAEQLLVESCVAREYQYTFYSLFRTDHQEDSCMYQYGMVAFYVNQQFITKFLDDVDAKTICYIPIDIYIAMHGPWYGTRNTIVKHNSTRFHHESSNS